MGLVGDDGGRLAPEFSGVANPSSHLGTLAFIGRYPRRHDWREAVHGSSQVSRAVNAVKTFHLSDIDHSIYNHVGEKPSAEVQEYSIKYISGGKTI
jgi:hypothetical protein